METFQACPPPAPPAPAQGPPSALIPGTPLMPDSSSEAYVVEDLHDTPEIMVVSSKDEAMEGFEGHLEAKDYPKEDRDIDEAVVEQQLNQEINEAVVVQQVEQEADEVELGVSNSGFDSGEEPEDESDPDYDPSRDC